MSNKYRNSNTGNPYPANQYHPKQKRYDKKIPSQHQKQYLEGQPQKRNNYRPPKRYGPQEEISQKNTNHNKYESYNEPKRNELVEELLPTHYTHYREPEKTSINQQNVERKKPKYVQRKPVVCQQSTETRELKEQPKQEKKVQEIRLTIPKKEEAELNPVTKNPIPQKYEKQPKFQQSTPTAKETYKVIMPFEHPQHSHNNNFKLNFSDNLVNIVYKNNNGRRAFIKNGEIAPNASSSFKIRQVKTEDRCIFIGIATNSIFSDPKAVKGKFTATYYSRDGKLCLDGADKAGGRGVKDGQIVNFCVNTKNWELRWSIGAQQQVKAAFPESLKNKSLYLMIVMGHKDDTVQVLYN